MSTVPSCSMQERSALPPDNTRTHGSEYETLRCRLAHRLVYQCMSLNSACVSLPLCMCGVCIRYDGRPQPVLHAHQSPLAPGIIPPPIRQLNEPQPSPQQLQLYERGIISVHMECERDDCCCCGGAMWRWPKAFPPEAENLYTQEEWKAFGRQFTEHYQTHNTVTKQNLIKLVQSENKRIKLFGLEWVIDSFGLLKHSEFILTWMPQLREQYEFEHSDARRVANQPVPHNLKYAWYLSAANPNRTRSSDVLVDPAHQRFPPSSPAGPASQVMVDDTHSQVSVNQHVTCEAVGMYSFNKSYEGQLSFNKGDVLKLLTKPLCGWVTVENALGQRGHVPANYIQLKPNSAVVELIKPVEVKSAVKPAVQPAFASIPFTSAVVNPVELDALALYNFAGGVVGQLPFRKGDLMRVLSDTHAGWLHVQHQDGRKGYIPENFVQLKSRPFTPSVTDQSHFYRNGICSMHYRSGEPHMNGTKLWGFPPLPAEAGTLYTHDEWNRFIDELTIIVRNQTSAQPIDHFLQAAVNKENSRKQSEGLKWHIKRLGMPMKWEYILTWLPNIRQQYEHDHPNARRVSEEAPPSSLKHQFTPSVAFSPTIASTFPKTSIVSPSSTSSHHSPPLSSSVPSPSAPEYPPMPDEPPPPAYDQLIHSHELAPIVSSPSHALVSANLYISDEGQQPIHTVPAVPISGEKNQLMNSIPMTHNVIRSSSPSIDDPGSPVIIPTFQYCNSCGTKRDPGSGAFCGVCGQRIPTTPLSSGQVKP